MKRKIITIDEQKCNGCGLCANACHESAIAIIDGKAKLIRDDYCDGMGDCLPHCPMEAISFEIREALEYNEEAVKENKEKINQTKISKESSLTNWPVQIQLAPMKSKDYHNAHLLIAADCTAFSYASFHEDFIKGRVCLIGCPKLDKVNYADKLKVIIRNNNFIDITVVRSEVPCCSKLVDAVKEAVNKSNKELNIVTYTISTEGKIL